MSALQCTHELSCSRSHARRRFRRNTAAQPVQPRTGLPLTR